MSRWDSLLLFQENVQSRKRCEHVFTLIPIIMHPTFHNWSLSNFPWNFELSRVYWTSVCSCLTGMYHVISIDLKILSTYFLVTMDFGLVEFQWTHLNNFLNKPFYWLKEETELSVSAFLSTSFYVYLGTIHLHYQSPATTPTSIKSCHVTVNWKDLFSKPQRVSFAGVRSEKCGKWHKTNIINS